MQKVLLCLDTDPQPSVFDSVVAVDAGVDQLFRHGGVTPDQVQGLVHGAMFTRAPGDLKNTAVFVGGADVEAAEALFKRVTGSFFGPIRVSALMDANGSNTTAAAAVVSAARHVDLKGGVAAVIGTGAVGRRAARMLGGEGAEVRIVSRATGRASQVCESLAGEVTGGRFVPRGTSEKPLTEILSGVEVVIAAGPAGAEVFDANARSACATLKVVIDLNAVPPLGVGGIGSTDKAVERDGQTHYGAIGVGGLKMRVHQAALRTLFETNDAVLDADEVFEIAKRVESGE